MLWNGGSSNWPEGCDWLDGCGESAGGGAWTAAVACICPCALPFMLKGRSKSRAVWICVACFIVVVVVIIIAAAVATSSASSSSSSHFSSGAPSHVSAPTGKAPTSSPTTAPSIGDSGFD